MKTRNADPLLQSLLFVSQYHGITTSAEQLVAGLPLQDNQLTPTLFQRAAKRCGIVSRITASPLASMQSHLLPVILLLKDGDACVLVGWNDDRSVARVRFSQLIDSVEEIPAGDLAELYQGQAFLVRPRFRFDLRAPSLSTRRSGHWFWQAIKQNRRIYRDVLVSALFINLFALALPFFTMNVYDRVVPNSAIETLWVLSIGMLIVVLMDLLLKTLRAYFIDLASKRVDIVLSADIMEQVLGMRLEHRPPSVGSFASNLRAYESIRDFITSMTISVLIDLPFFLIFLLVIFWVAPLMSVPLLVSSAIIVLYGLSVRRNMQELTETSYRAAAMRSATLVESLVGLETLKAMGAERVMQQRWEKSAGFLARIGIQQRLLSQSNGNLGGAVQQLNSVAMVITGVYLISAGNLTMGGLIACTMLASRGLAPLGQASGLIMQYHTAKTAMTSLDEIMAKEVERPINNAFVSRPRLQGEIEFRNVSFHYPGTEMPVLKDVSFTVKAGDHVAVLGRNGSGKSTISKLILGLYQPTSGAILVDGVDIRQIDPAELRQQMGYAPQDITLFYGTLRDNLSIGYPQADDQDVLHAAELANLQDFVNQHPLGFDMPIGERGDSLSGGQRKAIGVARALIHNPPVIVLDEPTGSMDHTSESHVKMQLQMFSRGKTLFVITHRTSLLDLVNRILVIDNGQIVADGPKSTVVEALRSGRIGRA